MTDARTLGVHETGAIHAGPIVELHGRPFSPCKYLAKAGNVSARMRLESATDTNLMNHKEDVGRTNRSPSHPLGVVEECTQEKHYLVLLESYGHHAMTFCF